MTHCAHCPAWSAARSRVARVAKGFQETFGREEHTPVAVLSAPGRTEIGGNHTDHQRGRVLAAAVNLDFLACAAPNGTQVIRFQSEGWPMVEVDLNTLEPQEEERETTASLVRGMAAPALSVRRPHICVLQYRNQVAALSSAP